MSIFCDSGHAAMFDVVTNLGSIVYTLGAGRLSEQLNLALSY